LFLVALPPYQLALPLVLAVGKEQRFGSEFWRK
jgi:hypothetical protein